jgi:hypothetical protein
LTLAVGDEWHVDVRTGHDVLGSPQSARRSSGLRRTRRGIFGTSLLTAGLVLRGLWVIGRLAPKYDRGGGASAARTANLPLLRGVHAICGQAYEFSAPTAIALRGADLFVADEERNDVTELNTATGCLVRSRLGVGPGRPM